MTAASWVAAGSSTTQSPQAGGPSVPASRAAVGAQAPVGSRVARRAAAPPAQARRGHGAHDAVRRGDDRAAAAAAHDAGGHVARPRVRREQRAPAVGVAE